MNSFASRGTQISAGKISVVVVTYQRNDVLLDTVDDLLRQDHRNFDVTVVDQNAAVDPRLRQRISNDSRLSVLRLHPPHMCVARNVGIRASDGEIVVFVDDDIRCEENLLSNYAERFARGQIAGIGGVGGWVDADGPEHVHHMPEGSIRAAIGCNMAYRRDVLEEVGGFDTNLQPPATYGDEIELAARVKRAGYKIVAAPEARVFHRRSESGGLRSEPGVEFWQASTTNHLLVFSLTRPFWQRAFTPIWLVKLWRTMRRLSGERLSFSAFVGAIRLGRRLANKSRATASFFDEASQAEAL